MSNLTAIETVRARLSLDTPDGIRLGESATAGPLTLIPLFHEAATLDYLLSADAQLSGQVTVSEVSAAGEVSSLLVANQADLPVLFVEGEVLVGLKQNRVINTTMLIPARTEIKVPVTCVEQGRWHSRTTAAGRDPYHLSAKVRGTKQRTMAAAMRASGQYRADQSAVWDSVQERLGAHRLASPSLAYSDINLARTVEINASLSELKPAPGQKGVLVFSGGKPTCLDVFDRSSTMESLWEGLVGSYVADAMVEQKAAKPADLAAARTWLGQLASGQATEHPGVGLGNTVALTGASITAGALVVDGVLLHLAGFQDGQTGGTRFNRSWRRP